MEISYDPAKNAANIKQRGLSFDGVVGFDFQTAFIWPDIRKDYCEMRYCALGLLDGRVHALVFTETAVGVRIISFRKANKREVRRYEKASKS